MLDVPGTWHRTPLGLVSQFFLRRNDFLVSIAQATVNALTVHFQSLSPESSVALELQRPDAWTGGDHLSADSQERCVPPHIVEARNVWLTDQCDAHTSGRSVSHHVQSPFVRGAPDPPSPLSIPVPGDRNLGCPREPATCFAPIHWCTSSRRSHTCVCTNSVL